MFPCEKRLISAELVGPKKTIVATSIADAIWNANESLVISRSQSPINAANSLILLQVPVSIIEQFALLTMLSFRCNSAGPPNNSISRPGSSERYYAISIV